MITTVTTLWRSLLDRAAWNAPAGLQEEGKTFADSAAEAAKALETIHCIMKERLVHAAQLHQAMERQAPEAEIHALQQRYREAVEDGNAELSFLLERLNVTKAGVAPASDDPSGQGHLTEAALARRLQRLKAAG
jgi:hypothetical protein